jgi:hypothetical protein
MSATDEAGVSKLCLKWMPRSATYCARQGGHPGKCLTAAALVDRRPRKTSRRRGVRIEDDPAVKARWNRAYKFTRLGITEEEFNGRLEAQGYCCTMCRLPFEEDRRICADHDHNCCETQPKARAKTCGKCIRGLLCFRCNTALGYVELYGRLAQAYLDRVAAAKAAA